MSVVGPRGPLDDSTAHAIYDVLVEHVDASESWRDDFVFHHTRRYCDEYRLSTPRLGFGGKFRRDPYSRRPDGSLGEAWRVDCYPEDRTERSDALLALANTALERLRTAAAEAP